MQLIGQIADKELDSISQISYLNGWKARIAVRAVLFNDDGNIALMNLSKYGAFKLPGGGVDEEENLEAAFIREIKEETGCTAKATGDLGIFVEQRNNWKMLQVSFCYLAKVVKMGELELTEEETVAGFRLEWHTIDEAIELVSNSKALEYDNRFIRMRDTQILKAAKDILER